MFEQLALACEADDCRRPLDENSLMLAMTTPEGTRTAHECSCGAVTITVLRE